MGPHGQICVDVDAQIGRNIQASQRQTRQEVVDLTVALDNELKRAITSVFAGMLRYSVMYLGLAPVHNIIYPFPAWSAFLFIPSVMLNSNAFSFQLSSSILQMLPAGNANEREIGTGGNPSA